MFIYFFIKSGYGGSKAAIDSWDMMTRTSQSLHKCVSLRNSQTRIGIIQSSRILYYSRLWFFFQLRQLWSLVLVCMVDVHLWVKLMFFGSVGCGWRFGGVFYSDVALRKVKPSVAGFEPATMPHPLDHATPTSQCYNNQSDGNISIRGQPYLSHKPRV